VPFNNITIIIIIAIVSGSSISPFPVSLFRRLFHCSFSATPPTQFLTSLLPLFILYFYFFFFFFFFFIVFVLTQISAL
jgi:hypothetical protein